MKNLVIFAIFLFSTASLSAQWKIGPKVSFGTILQTTEAFRIFPQSDRLPYDLQYAGGSPIFSVGFMAYKDIGPFFLQSELNATNYRLNFQMDDFTTLSNESPFYQESYQIIELPIFAGMTHKNFKFGLGVVADFKFSKNSDFENFDEYVDNTNNLEMAFGAVVGYAIGNVHIDLRYTNKFSSISDSFNFAYDNITLNKSANRLSIGIGMVF